MADTLALFNRRWAWACGLVLALAFSACGGSGGGGNTPSHNYANSLRNFSSDPGCAGGNIPVMQMSANNFGCLKCLDTYCNGPGGLTVNCAAIIAFTNCNGCGFFTFLCDGNTPLPTPGSAQQHFGPNPAAQNRVVQAISAICRTWLPLRKRRVQNSVGFQNATC